MIAAGMLYCVGIGLAFVIAGQAIEWALHLAGRQTRWAWCLALAGTLGVPAAAWLAPEAFSTVPVPLSPAVALEPVNGIVSEPAVAAGSLAQAEPAFSLSDLDGALRWGWGLTSAALLLGLTAGALRLSVSRRRWRASLVDGRRVLVSDNVGPAVAGLWSPRIVVPAWALRLTDPQRELMLTHEEEHVRAGDPRLLAWGALALVVAPWNPALWWQLRRLHLAIEMDCDARVLGRAGRAAEYGELLVQVGRRRSRLALSAPALGEPASFLERRIRRMATALPPWRWSGAVAGLLVAAGAVIAACEAPRPVEPEHASAANARRVRERVDSAMAERLRPWIRENLERYYPDVLRELRGPPVDIWFGHDSRRRVSHIGRTVGASGAVTSDRIRAIFPIFRPGNDAWGTVDRRVLKGMVRDNVRVTWVHLSAGVGEVALMPHRAPASQRAATLVREHFARLLTGRDEPVYVWLMFDAQGRFVAKGTAPRSLGARGMSTDRGPRLIPGYDTLLPRHVQEYGILGYGALAPNSPPVMWVRLGSNDAGVANSTGMYRPGPVPFLRPDSVGPYFNPPADYLRRLARQYHPEAFVNPQPGTAVVLVFDAQDRVVGHTAGVRNAGDRRCRDVVTRLLPEVRFQRFASLGCADVGDKGAVGAVVVYWGSLRRRS